MANAQQPRQAGIGMAYDVDAADVGMVRDGRQHIGARISAKVGRAPALRLIRGPQVVGTRTGPVSESGWNGGDAAKGEQRQGGSGLHSDCHGDDSFLRYGYVGQGSLGVGTQAAEAMRQRLGNPSGIPQASICSGSGRTIFSGEVRTAPRLRRP
jgi:hypothetical protein